jgi:hypothetical protein
MTASYIYVMTNERERGIVKIGRTNRSPALRACEIPGRWEVAWSAWVANAPLSEWYLHKLFAPCRVSKWLISEELFKVPVEEAIEAADACRALTLDDLLMLDCV